MMSVVRKLGRGYGNWVVGDQFFDRQEEIRLLKTALGEGSNILIVAQRRIGKTSLIREAARLLRDDYLCLQVDLQKAASAAEAILELSLATRPHLPLWGKVLSLFGNFLDQVAGRIQSLKKSDITVALRAGINEGNWQNKGDRLFELLSRTDKPVIVFFDELPILVNRMLRGSDFRITPERREKAEAFMSWLRSITIRYQGKIRIVIAGSVGLRPVLQQAGLNATVNNFMPFPLAPWRSEVAVDFLQVLADESGLQFHPDVAQKMVDLLGCCVPHYVKMFFEFVYQGCTLEGKTEVSNEYVQNVYHTRLLGAQGRTELSHYEERLRMMGDDFYKASCDLLTEAAVVGSLTLDAAEVLVAGRSGDKTAPEFVRETVTILEHDGYLQQTEVGSYIFISNLVRDWNSRMSAAFGALPSERRPPSESLRAEVQPRIPDR
jgi:hypothetical protein